MMTQTSILPISISILLSLLLTPTPTPTTAQSTNQDLEEMFLVMERETLSYAKQMEEYILPSNKCSSTTLTTCTSNNYNGCLSELPSPTCPGGIHRMLSCGRGEEGGCSGLMDFASSRVSLVRESLLDSIGIDIDSPSEREVDGICYSRAGDEFVVDERARTEEYWRNYGVSSPTYIYGNDDGVFRMLPGTLEECPRGYSTYDPRIRPWYVAASSGPKDVILILDTSGSMSNQGRLDIMKEAARRVIETLGIGDYFSVIEFNSNAQYVGSSRLDDVSDGASYGEMWRATDENKNIILEEIDNLIAVGGTFFQSGFDLAFDTFQRSSNAEKTSGCHKAILFLTDGEASDNESTLMDSIRDHLSYYNSTSSSSSSAPVLFTYSFGSGADDTLPKNIACQNDGIWSSIEDGGDLAKSMGAYYKYFAYGLSGSNNDDFVAWVQPYTFFTSGELGTTASAPVYDRSVFPPILAGVVGLDFSLIAMRRALGGNGGDEDAIRTVIQRIVERSVATCPNLELSSCQLQSLREFGSTDESNQDALCDNILDSNGLECNTTALKSPLCSSISTPNGIWDNQYPNSVWDNTNNRGRTMEEKSCCTVGEEPRIANTLSYDEVKELVCIERNGRIGLIVGVAIGSIVGLCLFVAVGIWFRYKRPIINDTRPSTTGNSIKPFNNQSGNFPVSSNISPIEDEIVVMPPPTAPQLQP